MASAKDLLQPLFSQPYPSFLSSLSSFAQVLILEFPSFTRYRAILSKDRENDGWNQWDLAEVQVAEIPSEREAFTVSGGRERGDLG